jgi:hypothetical protein
MEAKVYLAAGLAVALLGAIPLLWLATLYEGDLQAADATTTTMVIDNTDSVPSAPTTTLVIDGVPESVAEVLLADGAASSVGIDELPASVVAVLSQRGVVLTVPTQGGG